MIAQADSPQERRPLIRTQCRLDRCMLGLLMALLHLPCRCLQPSPSEKLQ